MSPNPVAQGRADTLATQSPVCGQRAFVPAPAPDGYANAVSRGPRLLRQRMQARRLRYKPGGADEWTYRKIGNAAARRNAMLVHEFAEYAVKEQTSKLPPEVIHHAKRAVIDWYAAFLPGRLVEPATL